MAVLVDACGGAAERHVRKATTEHICLQNHSNAEPRRRYNRQLPLLAHWLGPKPLVDRTDFQGLSRNLLHKGDDSQNS